MVWKNCRDAWLQPHPTPFRSRFIDLFLVAVTSTKVSSIQSTLRSNRLVIKSETFTESWGKAFGNMADDNTRWHEREQKWNCLRLRFEGEHKGVGINRHDYASQHNKQGITLSWLWCYCWKQPVPKCHILYLSKLHQPPQHHCWEGKKSLIRVWVQRMNQPAISWAFLWVRFVLYFCLDVLANCLPLKKSQWWILECRPSIWILDHSIQHTVYYA